jgi:hypothetical protein
MQHPSCGPARPNFFRRVIAALFGRGPRFEDRSNWGEPPPDIGVREPRRPRPSGSGGAAILDPPAELG